MTTNRTSRLVYDIIHRRMADESTAFDGVSFNDVMQICYKYLKMEQKLQTIVNKCDPTYDGATCDQRDAAQEALSFDPLSMTNPLTPDELQDIKRRLKGWQEGGYITPHMPAQHHAYLIIMVASDVLKHAPNDLARCLEEIERLRSLLAD